MNTWYCPKCGRDGFRPGYTPKMHARHCQPPRTIPLAGSPSQRYYWRMQLWRASSMLSASDALVVRMAFARAVYEMETAA